MATNDFLPFAGGAGANVLTQSAYLAQTALRSNGFSAGTAQSAQLNKVWRQASVMSAVLAQMISDNAGVDVIDDGTTATILANLKAAVGGRLIGVQVFTSSGTYTPTPGTKSVLVEVIGSGGGSAGLAATGGSTWRVSGGGGGGAAGTSGGGSGGNGDTTSFGALVSASGGQGSNQSVITPTATLIAVGGSGGLVIAGSGIIYQAAGPRGSIELMSSNGQIGGDGAPSGKGGAAGVGAGNASAGNAGVTTGSGGGGVCLSSSSSAKAGVAGANGLIIV
ncbi:MULTISPECIES: hypothetical protein [Pseudomonas]|uniref:hypothetical protein n=1 Tax=Pseudomonas TaxID=286 RepID=UPI0009DE9284|nr:MULTISPECIES: hypothetical protein [Pseudomonas]MBH3433675.1 hypothetical protein [Pseudomonas citronellolis]